jgi:hypothetical protein
MAGNFPESRLVEIWRDHVAGRTDLITEDDEPVRIVYPGRLNKDRGADYSDAVIASGRGILKGDVEIHVKSSSWWAHRHHRDPVYNRVVLHVVFWNDVDRAVILQNGRKVPTLALHKFIRSPGGDGTGSDRASLPGVLPCRNTVRRWGGVSAGEILDAAGEQRFFSRVDGFQAEVRRTGASQTLYRGIMGALGYSKNKLPMLGLAERMPLCKLEAAAPGEPADDGCLAQYQARLMGTAGLLPSQRSGKHGVSYREDNWLARLERVWAGCQEIIPMCEDDWYFFKVRPGNLPDRRIAAMCHLLLRYRNEGILAGLLGRLDEAAGETGYREIERALLITYGSCRGIGGCHPPLLGRGRAADIAVNVLLPFAVAWGRANARPELAGKAVEIYRCYPRLAENALERHMVRQLGTGRYMVSTARRQQGLLHIYKTLCSQGRCRQCPLAGESRWPDNYVESINVTHR